jgi:hypothetical protein
VTIKTLAKFRQERFYLDSFAAELSKAKSFQDVVELVYRVPANRRPANRRYYTNLSIFIHTCSIPEEATWEEIELYLELVSRLKVHSPDLFMPQTLDRIERSLEKRLQELENR